MALTPFSHERGTTGDSQFKSTKGTKACGTEPQQAQFSRCPNIAVQTNAKCPLLQAENGIRPSRSPFALTEWEWWCIF